jgi:hypothetical protein
MCENPRHSRWVSQGRFRVVGCGAFRLGFDGGLGGESENMSLFASVVRQVLAQSQESCRRELDRLGLARLPLDFERIEFLIEALVRRFSGVDRAADVEPGPGVISPRHGLFSRLK